MKVIIEAENRATGVLNQVSASLERVQTRIGPAAEMSKRFGFALGGLTASLGALGFTAVKTAGNLETQRIGFTTLLGSVEEADAAIKMIQKDAASTPFEMAGLMDANMALTLVTKNAPRSEEVLLNVGKALSAAGKGQPELDRIIANLQQIGNTGQITEMDIRQFGYAGINVLELLADYYGTTKEEAGEMVKNSKDGFADLEGAFNKAGSEGGRFADAFKNMNGSLNQMISNLADSWNIFLSNQGARVMDWAKAFVGALTSIVNNVLPAWIDKIGEAARWIVQHKDALVAFAGAILGLLAPAVIAATVAFGQFIVAMAPFVIIGAAVGLAVKALAEKFNISFADIQGFASRLWNGISAAFTMIVGKAQELWSYFMGTAYPKLKLFFEGVGNILVFFAGVFAKIFGALITIAKPILESIMKVVGDALMYILDAAELFGAVFTGNWGKAFTALDNMTKRAWNSIVGVTETALRLLLGPINMFIDGLNRIGFSIEHVSPSLDALRLGVEDVSQSVEQNFTPAIQEAADGQDNLIDKFKQSMDSLFGAKGATDGLAESTTKATSTFPGLGGAAGAAAGDVSAATDKMGDAMDKLNDEAQALSDSINQSLDEVRDNIAQINSDMNNVLTGQAEDTLGAQQTVAEAYVKAEQDIADKRVEISEEADATKRNKMQQELAAMEANLAEHANIETTFQAEVTQVRNDAAKTDLERAIAAFQKSILLINQKAAAETLALQQKLEREKEAEASILAIKDAAVKATQAFVLSDERTSIESINRQIEAYNQLAKAVQNAKQGKSTGTFSLVNTLNATSALAVPAMAEGGIVTRPTLVMAGEAGSEAIVPLEKAGLGGTNITIVIKDNEFLGEEGIADRLMKQIMQGIRANIAIS